MNLRTFLRRDQLKIPHQWFSPYANIELAIMGPVNESRQKAKVFILPKYCHALAFQQSECTHRHILISTHTYKQSVLAAP